MGLEIDRDLCRNNVMRVVEAVETVNGFVRFDMEDHTKTDATLDIWRAAHDRYAQVGVVIQSALRRSSADVDAITAAGGRVRLCKGAYDEPSGVAYRTKQAVDANYARLMERLPAGGRACRPSATHDPQAHRPRHPRSSRGRGSRATGSSSRCSTASGGTSSGC